MINKIIEHVAKLLDDELVNNECKYFQKRMKNEFKNFKVIIPDNPTLCVVIGAAYHAIRSNHITAKKGRYSFGVRVRRTINELYQ